MDISLIELLTASQGKDRHSIIADSLETALNVESWGFKRIWYAEHHDSSNFLSRAPEVIIPYIAAHTKTIKVGSGAVLLNHYSPYKVMENFTQLSEIFPGRIDLGLGRAVGSLYTAMALQRKRDKDQHADDSEQQLKELLHWVNKDFPEDHPFSQLKANYPLIPDIWISGSSAWSANAAAALGLQYVFAGFINPVQAYELTRKYFNNFRPSTRKGTNDKPRLILGLSVYCGETEQDAGLLAAPSMYMFKVLHSSGSTLNVMKSENDALKGLGQLPKPSLLTDSRNLPSAIIGTPSQVRKQIEEIASAFGTDEIMIHCIHPDHKRRLHSLRLLAEAMELF